MLSLWNWKRRLSYYSNIYSNCVVFGMNMVRWGILPSGEVRIVHVCYKATLTTEHQCISPNPTWSPSFQVIFAWNISSRKLHCDIFSELSWIVQSLLQSIMMFRKDKHSSLERNVQGRDRTSLLTWHNQLLIFVQYSILQNRRLAKTLPSIRGQLVASF